MDAPRLATTVPHGLPAESSSEQDPGSTVRSASAATSIAATIPASAITAHSPFAESTLTGAGIADGREISMAANTAAKFAMTMAITTANTKTTTTTPEATPIKTTAAVTIKAITATDTAMITTITGTATDTAATRHPRAPKQAPPPQLVIPRRSAEEPADPRSH